MGHPEITNLRQGKYFEVEIDGLENKETVRQLMEELSRDVLCNPIIESFEIEDIWGNSREWFFPVPIASTILSTSSKTS